MIEFSYVESGYSQYYDKWIPGNKMNKRTVATFAELVEWCMTYYRMSFTDKAHAPLLSAGVYDWAVNKYRGNKNVIGWDLAVVDIDTNPMPVEDCHQWLMGEGYNHIIYTSASSKPDYHKYRVILSLSRRVSANEIPACWHAYNQFFGHTIDGACKDASRVYYVPGQYGSAGHAYINGFVRGIDYPVDAMIERYPLLPPAPKRTPKSGAVLRDIEDADLSWQEITGCPYIRQAHFQHYSQPDIEEGHYPYLFKVMLSCARLATSAGVRLSPDQLFDIAVEFDAVCGGYVDRKYDHFNTRLRMEDVFNTIYGTETEEIKINLTG